MAQYTFTEQECWICTVPLSFDPFGKGFATVSAETDENPGGAMDEFINEFVGRFEQIWTTHCGILFAQGFTMPELLAAHQSTVIVVWEFTGGIPSSWSLECVFDFPDGPVLSYGLDFRGWITDGHFTGCH